MTKDQAAKKKAEWLRGCLECGWGKESLDDLSRIWDEYKDEYGNIRPHPESTTTLPVEGGAQLSDEEVDKMARACADKKFAPQSHRWQHVVKVYKEAITEYKGNLIVKTLAMQNYSGPHSMPSPAQEPFTLPVEDVKEKADKYASESIPEEYDDDTAEWEWVRDAYLAGAQQSGLDIETFKDAYVERNKEVNRLKEALEAIVKMKREPGETTDTYAFNRCWRIASEALAAHHQQGGKEELNDDKYDLYKRTVCGLTEMDQRGASINMKVSYLDEQLKDCNFPRTATGGWVKVEDQLPQSEKKNQNIFCLVVDTYWGIAVRPFNENHHCWDLEDGDDYYTDAVGGKITHWMPLPEPPKS